MYKYRILTYYNSNERADQEVDSIYEVKNILEEAANRIYREPPRDVTIIIKRNLKGKINGA